MQELGPRFTLKLRSLQKGTFDSKYGAYIWTHNVSPSTHCMTVVQCWFCLSLYRENRWIQPEENFTCRKNISAHNIV